MNIFKWLASLLGGKKPQAQKEEPKPEKKMEPKRDPNQLIYEAALKYLGEREVPGSASNPKIAEMFKLAPDWLDQDDSKTAWCGIFRGWIGHQTETGMPKEHYRAKNWLEWGNAVSSLAIIQKGDTVIFKRSGGYHVALFDSHAVGNFINVLGGNQSNAVSIAKYSTSDIVGIRRAV